MTTTPTIEKTEGSKCNVCARDCVRLCARCGSNFCTRHLIAHSEKCSGYRGIIHSILRDDLADITKQILEAVLRTV